MKTTIHEILAHMKDSPDAAERVVYALWKDVTDRRGWRQAADSLDDEVIGEILDTWLAIIRKGGQP